MHPAFAPLRAALFDLDGTLVRTFIDFPGMRRAMHDLAERHGAGEAVAEETDTLGILEKAAAVQADPAAFRREANRILEELEEAGCAHPEPIEGADTLLRRLRSEQDVAVGVVTRNTRRIAERLLARLELPFDVLVAREDTPEFKPHPAPLLVACAHLGVPPSETSMTGDLWADIAAGRAAGMAATVGIHWPHDAPDRFERCPPDFEVTSLAEALPLFLNPQI